MGTNLVFPAYANGFTLCLPLNPVSVISPQGSSLQLGPTSTEVAVFPQEYAFRSHIHPDASSSQELPAGPSQPS